MHPYVTELFAQVQLAGLNHVRSTEILQAQVVNAQRRPVVADAVLLRASRRVDETL